MKPEYRVVCSKFNEPHHGGHWKKKKDKSTAVYSIIIQNREAAALKPDYFDALEAPFQMQMRQVTEWKNTP